MKQILLIILFVLTCASVRGEVLLQHREGFLEVPGGPVWYRVTGHGDGVPLLILHGGPGATSCRFSILEPLGINRPVVRYDQLGSGRSGRPTDMALWQVDRFVEELHTIRQGLGLDRVHLLGHSWGAALAAQYVLQKGAKGIISLTLSSPYLSTAAWIEDANFLRKTLPDAVQQTLDEHEAAGTTDSDEYKDAASVYYERFFFAGERFSNPNCDGAPRNAVIYEHMWGPTEFYVTGNLLDFDITDQLQDLDLPVLLITGEYDEARPETVARFQQLLPNARLEIIEDAGHLSFSKQPEQYRKVLADFLNEVER